MEGLDHPVARADVLEGQDRPVATTNGVYAALARAPQVSFDDTRVVLDLLRRAFGDLLAVVEDGHAVAHPHHDLHVVLDQEDCPSLVAQLADEVRHLGRLARIHAGHRLVEQQEPGARRERTRDLEPTLLAVRQVLGQLVAAIGQADELERGERVRGDPPLLGPHPHRAEQRPTQLGARPAVAAHARVVERAHVAEEPDVLEGARHAEWGDAVRRQAPHLVPGHDDSPGRRAVDARHHVQHRRLAGAVGADEPADLPVLDDEVQAREGREAAEAHGETHDLQHRHAGRPAQCPLRASAGVRRRQSQSMPP